MVVLKILGAVVLCLGLTVAGVLLAAFIGGLFNVAGAAATAATLPVLIASGITAWWLVFRVLGKQGGFGDSSRDEAR